MSTTAQYASTAKQAIVAIATANTAKDGTGTIGTVYTAGASGSRIDAINAKATVTTTAGMLRLFIHNGTTAFLLTEIPINAVTSGATANSWECQLNNNTMSQLFPILLPTGYSLRASTNNAENLNVFAQGGDF
jgi:hypothetical protein